MPTSIAEKKTALLARGQVVNVVIVNLVFSMRHATGQVTFHVQLLVKHIQAPNTPCTPKYHFNAWDCKSTVRYREWRRNRYRNYRLARPSSYLIAKVSSRWSPQPFGVSNEPATVGIPRRV